MFGQHLVQSAVLESVSGIVQNDGNQMPHFRRNRDHIHAETPHHHALDVRTCAQNMQKQFFVEQLTLHQQGTVLLQRPGQGPIFNLMIQLHLEPLVFLLAFAVGEKKAVVFLVD